MKIREEYLDLWITTPWGSKENLRFMDPSLYPIIFKRCPHFFELDTISPEDDYKDEIND